MMVDVTRAERYLFTSEGILQFPPLVYETWQAFASLVFWIYVLLKQNWPHLPLPVIFMLLTLLIWPCGLKQWNTKEVSLKITIYILGSEALIVNSPFFHQSLSDCVSLSASQVSLTISLPPSLAAPPHPHTHTAERDPRTTAMTHLFNQKH